MWGCLKAWPIDADELVRVIGAYAEGKFRRGVTMKGVVQLSKGPMGESEKHIMSENMSLLTRIQMTKHTLQHKKPSTTKFSLSASVKSTA